MKIRNINTSINFGKTPVMLCEVKREKDKQKVNATLYKIDTKNHDDIEEIEYSKTARCLLRDILKDCARSHPYSDYYLLKEDKTGEVISCAQTSTHFRVGEDKKAGLNLLVEEINENSKYINPSESMFAFLADKAIKNYNQSIIIGTSEYSEQKLKRHFFTKTKNGEWFMPENRFSLIIDRAEKRCNMIV